MRDSSLLMMNRGVPSMLLLKKRAQHRQLTGKPTRHLPHRPTDRRFRLMFLPTGVMNVRTAENVSALVRPQNAGEAVGIVHVFAIVGRKAFSSRSKHSQITLTAVR